MNLTKLKKVNAAGALKKAIAYRLELEEPQALNRRKRLKSTSGTFSVYRYVLVFQTDYASVRSNVGKAAKQGLKVATFYKKLMTRCLSESSFIVSKQKGGPKLYKTLDSVYHDILSVGLQDVNIYSNMPVEVRDLINAMVEKHAEKNGKFDKFKVIFRVNESAQSSRHKASSIIASQIVFLDKKT